MPSRFGRLSSVTRLLCVERSGRWGPNAISVAPPKTTRPTTSPAARRSRRGVAKNTTGTITAAEALMDNAAISATPAQNSGPRKVEARRPRAAGPPAAGTAACGSVPFVDACAACGVGATAGGTAGETRVVWGDAAEAAAGAAIGARGAVGFASGDIRADGDGGAATRSE
jgi:hypothetical protein